MTQNASNTLGRVDGKLGARLSGFVTGCAFALLLPIVLIEPALAERSDRDKPVNIESDTVTVNDAKQIAVFEGNVVLTQGTLVIRGDRLEVRQDAAGFKYGTAWGKLAYFKQKREGMDEFVEGWAERVEYDGRADKLQLFQRAALKRNEDDVRGDYISYDATTEFFQVKGGGAKAATTNNPQGRSRMVIQPRSKTQPPAQPPLTLRPAQGIAAPRVEPDVPR